MLGRIWLTYYVMQLQTWFRGSLIVYLLFLHLEITPIFLTTRSTLQGFLLLIINEWPANDLTRQSPVIVHFSPSLLWALPCWWAFDTVNKQASSLKTTFAVFQSNRRNVHITIVERYVCSISSTDVLQEKKPKKQKAEPKWRAAVAARTPLQATAVVIIFIFAKKPVKAPHARTTSDDQRVF